MDLMWKSPLHSLNVEPHESIQIAENVWFMPYIADDVQIICRKLNYCFTLKVVYRKLKPYEVLYAL